MKEYCKVLVRESIENKAREWSLMLKRYLINNRSYKSFIILPLIIDYVSTLKKMGAYGLLIQEKISRIDFVDHNVATYCKAEVLFYKGQFSESIALLLSLREERNEDLTYLLYKNFIMLGHNHDAQSILYDLIEISSRKKTWMYISNMVETKESFEFFEKILFEKIKKNDFLKDINLVNYYSEAAIRAKEYGKAISVWIDFIKKNEKLNSPKKLKKKDFNSNYAEAALLDLRQVLVNADINFFLVSGTLLGCVRDNHILPHDKDLDIGIYNTEVKDKNLLKILSSSGYFEVLPTRIETQIKLKHLNGTYVDVFIHILQDNICWHYTSKIKWFNQKFDLVNRLFLNEVFLIPKNYNLYLSENYGEDWRIPKKNFDSNFDTPNAVIISQDEMQVFYVKMLAYRCLDNDISSSCFKRIVQNLRDEVKLCLKK